MLLLKNIESYLASDTVKADEKDVMSDIRYICKSCSLITESLQKGCDVMQMPNGDIIITEVKTFTFQYTWDEKKGKLVRVQSGGRLKKAKQRRLDVQDNDYEHEDEMEEVA
jgi:hypothetical protein